MANLYQNDCKNIFKYIQQIIIQANRLIIHCSQGKWDQILFYWIENIIFVTVSQQLRAQLFFPHKQLRYMNDISYKKKRSKSYIWCICVLYLRFWVFYWGKLILVQKNRLNQLMIVQVLLLYFQYFNNISVSMQPNENLSAHIKGRNFYGSVERKGGLLKLDITQFKKGAIYTYQINNTVLLKEYKRFLIFKKVDDIFNEIISNQRLEVTDQNTLSMPIDVTYKSKLFELKIEIPLNNRKFSNEAQKVQTLFQQIQKLNQQKINHLPDLIIFKADKTNLRLSTFQISEYGKKVKMLGKDQYTTLNHADPIKKKGISYFKVKIIKTGVKQLFLGICANSIRSEMNASAYFSPYFMGLHLASGQLFGNNKSPTLASGYTIVDGQSIIKIEINMIKKSVSWFHNDSFLCEAQITKELTFVDIYPMANLFTNGDTIEFLDK